MAFDYDFAEAERDPDRSVFIAENAGHLGSFILRFMERK